MIKIVLGTLVGLNKLDRPKKILGVQFWSDKSGNLSFVLDDDESVPPFVCCHLAKDDIKDMITYLKKVLDDD